MTVYFSREYPAVWIGKGTKYHAAKNRDVAWCGRGPIGGQVAFDVQWDDMCMNCLDALDKHWERQRETN